MERNHMEQSSTRILLNAEPFGFGPTTAIASFFPYLRGRFSHIAYMGEGHTLDLQRSLAYDAIFDSSEMDEVALSQIFKEYEVFVTAMDFQMAEFAKRQGLRVVIYDALAWYWKKAPRIVMESDLYIAQNFFGVEEQVKGIPNANVVGAIVPDEVSVQGRKYVLINLGGLQNPMWSLGDAIAYAKLFSEVLMQIVPEGKVKIATSRAIAEALPGPVVTSYSREKMFELLGQTACAFMTPGLGNIYDSAVYNIPTVWLPPANDSQGRQVELLKINDMTDESVDWFDLAEVRLDYMESQHLILKQITDIVRAIGVSSAMQDVMKHVFSEAFSAIRDKETSKTNVLLQTFGTGGAEEVATLIYDHVTR